MLTPHTLLQVSLWVAQFFYFACFIPQIITNFRAKSGAGVSDLLLVLYFNAYLFLLFYIYGLNLPIAYRVMVPLQTLATIVLVAQRIYYQTGTAAKKLLLLYSVNTVLFLFFIPVALRNPIAIGIPFGWASFCSGLISQAPQVVKIHYQKSVAGFSFGFVFLVAVAAAIEFAAAILAPLPLPTLFSALRGMVMMGIMSLQFVWYRTNA
jgi:uncharacterized protein with PQ loop repeat